MVTITGGFVYVYYLVITALLLTGVSALLMATYWVTDHAIKRTCIYFGIYEDFIAFLTERYRAKRKAAKKHDEA